MTGKLDNLYQSDEQDELLRKVEIILEREMENPVLLDDSVISLSWINAYSELINTREALHTDVAHFSTTQRQKDGSEKTFKDNEHLQQYKFDSIERFNKTFHKFMFDFEVFMQKKNKEININFG